MTCIHAVVLNTNGTIRDGEAPAPELPVGGEAVAGRGIGKIKRWQPTFP